MDLEFINSFRLTFQHLRIPRFKGSYTGTWDMDQFCQNINLGSVCFREYPHKILPNIWYVKTYRTYLHLLDPEDLPFNLGHGSFLLRPFAEIVTKGRLDSAMSGSQSMVQLQDVFCHGDGLTPYRNWYITHIYIWYDMIWYDMIWYDIWYDMIWYDMIWYIYMFIFLYIILYTHIRPWCLASHGLAWILDHKL